MTETIPLSSITKDSALQMREAMSEDTVRDYEDLVRSGHDMDPITVFRIGKKMLVVDGFHRMEAYLRAGAIQIEANVLEGDRDDAILYSVGANGKNGLNRTAETKRRAVSVLLDNPKWSTWSNSEIARRAYVSESLVRSLRSKRSDEPAGERTYTTRHGTEAVMSTGKIGKVDRAAEREAKQAEEAQFQADREALVAQLPADVRERMSAADAAKAQHAADGGETVGLPPEDRIAELEAKVESLEAELSAVNERNAELARFEAMEADFKSGGFDAVVAVERASVEHWKTKYHAENREKVAAQREAKRLRQGQASNDEAVVADWEVARAVAR